MISNNASNLNITLKSVFHIFEYKIAPNIHLLLFVVVLSSSQPYEYMKLRLLNGGHSALSYIGILSG